jgi:hypothetical protein
MTASRTIVLLVGLLAACGSGGDSNGRDDMPGAADTTAESSAMAEALEPVDRSPGTAHGDASLPADTPPGATPDSRAPETERARPDSAVAVPSVGEEEDDFPDGQEGTPAPEFDQVKTASVADASRDAPDPATFTSAFPANAPAIYIVYRLKPGPGGRVTATWRKDGEVLLQNDRRREIPSGGRWAFEAITPPPGGFLLGNYEVVLTIVETEESRTVPFTVTAAEGPQ